jgi:hypothetical protein
VRRPGSAALPHSLAAPAYARHNGCVIGPTKSPNQLFSGSPLLGQSKANWSLRRVAVLLTCFVVLTFDGAGSSASVRSIGRPGTTSSAVGSSSADLSWRRIRLPLPPGWAGGYEWAAIACSNKDSCLVGGAEGANQNSIMESTVNAGQTWASRSRFPSSMDGGIESAACDRENCFVAAENQAVNSQTIGRTSDWGKTWSVVSNPPMWAKRSITADLIACSAFRCLAYGTNIFAVPLGNLGGVREGFAATSNDGRSWTEISVPGAAGIDQMTCIWSGRCWVLYETPRSDLEQVATTIDGGSTWTALGPIRPSEVGGNTFVLDPDNWSGFACENAETCLILDNSDDLLVSADGGRTWANSLGPRDANDSVDFSTDALTCTPVSTCWVVSLTSAWIRAPAT